MTETRNTDRDANKLLITNGTTQEIRTIAFAVEELNESISASIDDRGELFRSVREITERLDELESRIHRLWRSQS